MNYLVLVKNYLPTKLPLALYVIIGLWDKRELIKYIYKMYCLDNEKN